MKLAIEQQARAEAAFKMPELPADCRVNEPHAPLTVGMEARTALKNERRALDRSNARQDRCAAFYYALDF